MGKRNHIEHQIQCGLIQWSRLMPAPVRLLYAIPNGGRRDKWEAARLKREGVLAGVHDLFLPAARRGFHGLYLETKKPGGALTHEQWIMAKHFQSEGYCVQEYETVDEGIDIISWYCGIKR